MNSVLEGIPPSIVGVLVLCVAYFPILLVIFIFYHLQKWVRTRR